MSRTDSVNNFIKAVKGEYNSSFTGYDGEYFSDNKFFVDNTCICKVNSDNNVMYLSMNSITPKLSLYTRELAVKSAELNVTVIYVPQWYKCDLRSHEFDKDGIISAFSVVINKLKDKKDIYSKQNLEEIKSMLELINNKCFEVPSEINSTVNEILEKMTAATQIEDAEVKEFIKNNCYYDIVQAAYFNNIYDVVFKTALKHYLNPSGEYAFLSYNDKDDRWYSSESICGIPKATMTGDEGWDIVTKYHDGTLKHGMKFGNYVAMKVMDNYLQVSCNKYSRAMFESCYQMKEKLQRK